VDGRTCGCTGKFLGNGETGNCTCPLGEVRDGEDCLDIDACQVRVVCVCACVRVCVRVCVCV
jgi:hypothetical protein